VAIAIVVGVHVQRLRGRQLQLDPYALSALASHVIVVGFIVSHVFDVIAYEPARVLRDPSALIDNLNISSFGGLLGALLGLYLWRRRYQLPVLPYADATVFGFVFAWFFGRLGCFSAHDHPGRHSDFFLAVANYRPLYAGDTRQPRHDLGLYEALFAMALSVAFAIAARRPRRPGVYVAAACLAYAPTRFLLDGLRVVDTRYLGLTPAQYGSLLLGALGLLVAARLRFQPTTGVGAQRDGGSPAARSA
jgi:phosphatidylglycerol:prolipoprotein diacylglycerol transferase